MAIHHYGVELKDINKPRSTHTRVAQNSVCRWPKEIKDFSEEVKDLEVSGEVTKNNEGSKSVGSDKQNLCKLSSETFLLGMVS